MDIVKRLGLMTALFAVVVVPIRAQTGGPDGLYYAAVAEFFELPASEVDILRDWRLPVDEIPVVLFVSRRAGVSAEALAQLRRAGKQWPELVTQYGLDAGQLHLPIADVSRAYALAALYQQYDSLEPRRWREVKLTDQDVVVLVNVRMAAQTLRMSPEDILEGHRTTPSFVALYARLVPLRKP